MRNLFYMVLGAYILSVAIAIGNIVRGVDRFTWSSIVAVFGSLPVITFGWLVGF